MFENGKADTANVLVTTAWLWLPASVWTSLYGFRGSPPGPALPRIVIIATALALLMTRACRVWLFDKRVIHFLLPVAAPIFVYELVGAPDDVVGILAAAAPALLGSAGVSWFLRDVSLAPDPDADPNFIRGSRRERQETVRRRADAATRPGDSHLVFGPLVLALSILTNHFLVLGMSSSGKTILSYLALQSFLPRIRPGSGKRALIYDAKGDTLSRLESLGYSGEVICTNFADARAAAWHLGEDFRESHTIAEASELLFPLPQNSHQNEFFDRAVQGIVQGVMHSWNTRFPGCLTLRDLILSLESETRLRHVLAWDMNANHARLQLYFQQRDTLANVMATIASKIEQYRAIAAFWHAAPHRFSLTEWRRNSSLIVLGRTVESQTAADNLNALLIARLSQLLIAGENSTEMTTYLCLDEVGKAGKLRGLDMLLAQGRSKGVVCWLGMQSIGGLRAIYGRDIAGDMTAACGNVAVLAVGDPDSAQFAEETFARHERWERSSGKSWGPHGTTTSSQWTIVTKPTVLAGEVLSIRPPSRRTGAPLRGFFKAAALGLFDGKIPLELIEQQIPDTTARGGSVEPDFAPAPPHHGILHRYSDEELHLLGLPRDDANLGPPTPEQPRPPAGGPRRPQQPRHETTPPSLSDIPNLFGKRKGR